MREMASSAASSSSSSAGGSSAVLEEMMRGLTAGSGSSEPSTAMEEMNRVWSHMNELMEKDPKAYSEFLEQQQLENARTEAQAALHEQLGSKPGMFPEPGFVLKTVTVSSALASAPARTTFINVVMHKHVLPPTLPNKEPVIDKDGKEHPFARTQAGSATVSMAVGHVRAMADNCECLLLPHARACHVELLAIVRAGTCLVCLQLEAALSLLTSSSTHG